MSEKNEKKEIVANVGGQAVIEGVMMKSQDSVAIAVRRESGEIVTTTKKHIAWKDKHKALNIPVLRGVVNFIDMMKLSMATLTESMEMVGFDEEPEEEQKTTKTGERIEATEKTEEQKKTDTSKMIGIASAIGIVLGIGLSFVLFIFLPTFLGERFQSFAYTQWDHSLNPAVISTFEAVLRLVIFFVYILLVSQMKDIRRTFEYHGAEHMAIRAYECGEDLIVENVRKHSRFHPRCGTSFIIVMILISVLVGMIIPQGLWFRVLIRFSLFPLVIGIGYEFIRLAGKHSGNPLVKIIAAPGMWFQRLTTKKPDDSQLEVAIKSLKIALKLEMVEPVETGEIIEVGEGIAHESDS